MNIGQWLRKSPQPSVIEADGQKIEVGNKGGKWRDMVLTLESMGATRIVAMDNHGSVLRAVTLEEEHVSASGKKEDESELQTFARLLAEGYEKGAKVQQPLLDNAMSFIERQSVRLAAAEREVERLRTVIQKLQGDLIQLKALPPTEGSNDMMQAVLAGFLQAQSQQPAAVEAAKNGVKK